jgi:hypothetical protein
MSEVATIQFTQDQARTLTGVSVESVRHWRKTIPYLSIKAGKAARFTFSEVIGLSITHELVNSFGIHIANMSQGIDCLFRLLASASPTSLEHSLILITRTEALLFEETPTQRHLHVAPALIFPLDPLLAKIQSHMLPATTSPSQVALPFPPEAVRTR